MGSSTQSPINWFAESYVPYLTIFIFIEKQTWDNFLILLEWWEQFWGIFHIKMDIWWKKCTFTQLIGVYFKKKNVCDFLEWLSEIIRRLLIIENNSDWWFVRLARQTEITLHRDLVVYSQKPPLASKIPLIFSSTN